MNYPSEFRIKEYLHWHEDVIPEDINLKDKIDSYRLELKKKSYEDLDFLAGILTSLSNLFKDDFEGEYRMVKFDIHVPILSLFKQDKETIIESDAYNLLFKSTDSIINKLWRKNKDNLNKKQEYIKFDNIEDNIGDLVRTNITTPTLGIAKRFVKSIHSDIKRVRYYNPNFDKFLLDIQIDPDMKMDKGYFAYHGTVRFVSGLNLELQIYSKISDIWREISHVVYEQQRGYAIETYDFNDTKSRLISLGHLLHLGECEIERLSEDILKYPQDKQ